MRSRSPRARSTSSAPLAKETGAKTLCLRCQPSPPRSRSCSPTLETAGAPDVVVYNASYRTRGPFADLDPAEVEKSIAVSAYGGFLVAQAAVKRMLPRGHGAILFTGASASVKGYAQSAPFAMGKFALRGLAQSMARELRRRASTSPISSSTAASRSARRPVPADAPDSLLDPDAIAQSYLRRAQPAAQRLDAGDRAAALGGEVLGIGCKEADHAACFTPSRF